MTLLMKRQKKQIKMKTKNEICVPIRNEAELQQASDILERNGCEIYSESFFLSKYKGLNYLKLREQTNTWIVSVKSNLTEISLSELESVLRGESESKKQSKKQSSIEWMFEEIKRRQEIIFSEPDGITRETMIDCLSNGLIQQAKQMHREEIVDAYISGYSATENHGDSTDYYNKTFKND